MYLVFTRMPGESYRSRLSQVFVVVLVLRVLNANEFPCGNIDPEKIIYTSKVLCLSERFQIVVASCKLSLMVNVLRKAFHVQSSHYRPTDQQADTCKAESGQTGVWGGGGGGKEREGEREGGERGGREGGERVGGRWGGGEREGKRGRERERERWER